MKEIFICCFFSFCCFLFVCFVVYDRNAFHTNKRTPFASGTKILSFFSFGNKIGDTRHKSTKDGCLRLAREDLLLKYQFTFVSHIL